MSSAVKLNLETSLSAGETELKRTKERTGVCLPMPYGKSHSNEELGERSATPSAWFSVRAVRLALYTQKDNPGQPGPALG